MIRLKLTSVDVQAFRDMMQGRASKGGGIFPEVSGSARDILEVIADITSAIAINSIGGTLASVSAEDAIKIYTSIKIGLRTAIISTYFVCCSCAEDEVARELLEE